MMLENGVVLEELRRMHLAELTKAFKKYKSQKMEKLLNLLKTGGKVVSSAHCSELEIAQAQSCGRMFIDQDGFGFVYLPYPTINVQISHRDVQFA